MDSEEIADEEEMKEFLIWGFVIDKVVEAILAILLWCAVTFTSDNYKVEYNYSNNEIKDLRLGLLIISIDYVLLVFSAVLLMYGYIKKIPCLLLQYIISDALGQIIAVPILIIFFLKDLISISDLLTYLCLGLIWGAATLPIIGFIIYPDMKTRTLSNVEPKQFQVVRTVQPIQSPVSVSDVEPAVLGAPVTEQTAVKNPV